MSDRIDKARRAAARSEVQKRVFTVNPEVRAASEGGDGSIGVSGHAAVFDTPSQPIYDFWDGSFIEEVRKGAFLKTIGEADIRFLVNHDPNYVLARNKSGTLRLSEDEIGLAVDADLAPTQAGRDLGLLMARGDVTQMSIMFSVVKDDWAGTRDGLPLRVISEIKLYDVSAVTFPAFEETDIGMRSRDVGALLHSLGLDTVPPEQRNNLIAALTRGVPIPTDLAPVLRAAQRALGELATHVEPTIGHSARSYRDVDAFLSAAATRYGLPQAAD